MEKKNLLKTPIRSSMKLLDAHSNFKKVRKLTPLREQEIEKKKKCVVFFEAPKEFKTPNIKKTQIIKNHKPKEIDSNFQTQIGNPSSKKKKGKSKKKSKIKSERTRHKMPTLKAKVININRHYFIPIITKFTPSTYIANKNEQLEKQKKLFAFKRVHTIETKIRKIDDIENKEDLDEKTEVNDNIISNKKDSKSKNTSESKSQQKNKKITLENKPFIMDNDSNINKSQQNNNHNYNQEEEKIIKKKEIKDFSHDEGENKSRDELKKINKIKTYNDNNNFEEPRILKDNNKNNKNKEKDEDNLTYNSHKKNNSVDSSKKNENNKWNIKNLFCCLFG